MWRPSRYRWLQAADTSMLDSEEESPFVVISLPSYNPEPIVSLEPSTLRSNLAFSSRIVKFNTNIKFLKLPHIRHAYAYFNISVFTYLDFLSFASYVKTAVNNFIRICLRLVENYISCTVLVGTLFSPVYFTL